MTVGRRFLVLVSGGRRGSPGQGAVEFALVVSMFFILLGGIIDAGRGYWYYSSLQDAVHQATRYAVVHGSSSSSPVGPTDGKYSVGPPSTDSTLTSIVTGYASSEGLKTSLITVSSSWPDGDNAPMHRVTVTANYSFQPFTRLISGLSLTITASSTRTIIN